MWNYFSEGYFLYTGIHCHCSPVFAFTARSWTGMWRILIFYFLHLIQYQVTGNVSNYPLFIVGTHFWLRIIPLSKPRVLTMPPGFIPIFKWWIITKTKKLHTLRLIRGTLLIGGPFHIKWHWNTKCGISKIYQGVIHSTGYGSEYVIKCH